jgi:two-component system sensor histidine kinase AtoS
MTLFGEQIFFILLSVSVLFILFLFILIRSFRKERKKTGNEQSELSFMVDTFHNLISQLKEKEKELEQLRRIAEDRADEVENYSDNIIQSVPSGVISLDNDLKITMVNSAASQILKLSQEHLVSKGYDEIFRSPIKEMIGKRKGLKRAEYFYRLDSGEKIWIEFSVSPLLNSTGESIGHILIFTDLTELKFLEKQIQSREWLSSLGEISLGIAHELRNPMAVISGYTKMLTKKYPSSIAEIDTIVKEINVMNRIIGDFLSFARPVTPTITDVDLKELLSNLLNHILRGRYDIKLQATTGTCKVEGDEVLLRQAFTNLIQNAVEAMPQGGTLSLDAELRDTTIAVTISDTGMGIPLDQKEKIFRPFFTTKEKGTGLGLSIVQKNITLSGGTISVESSEAGTTFSVVLPAGEVRSEGTD